MEIRPEPDGGATLRLSKSELVSLYNLENGFVHQAAKDPTVSAEWLRPARIRLHQIAVLLGRDDVPHPDDE
jgi:hypothetical protein